VELPWNVSLWFSEFWRVAAAVADVVTASSNSRNWALVKVMLLTAGAVPSALLAESNPCPPFGMVNLEFSLETGHNVGRQFVRGCFLPLRSGGVCSEDQRRKFTLNTNRNLTWALLWKKYTNNSEYCARTVTLHVSVFVPTAFATMSAKAKFKCTHEENRKKVCATCEGKIIFGKSSVSKFLITENINNLIKLHTGCIMKNLWCYNFLIFLSDFNK
jgi:hypothetical protein